MACKVEFQRRHFELIAMTIKDAIGPGNVLALAHSLERWLLKDVEPSHIGGEDMRVYHLDGGILGNLLADARAAIAKVEGNVP